ncbi:hypothetical protein NESM_000102800 [Novymonas esmeraldas]|uniref:Uncharacterized protein n=1 Tax=Novymonas esmeraldas TaxID=1808958 RepID=A0AAW0F5A9_9TRYP
MSEFGGYPTLLELCSPLPTAAALSSRHSSRSDNASPLGPSLAPVEAAFTTAGTGAGGSKLGSAMAAAASTSSLSTSVAAMAASPLHRRSLLQPAAAHDSHIPGSRANASPEDGSLDLHVKEGVTMSSAPFHLTSRRATLPFVGGDPAAVDGGLRTALLNLVASSEDVDLLCPVVPATRSSSAVAVEAEETGEEPPARLDVGLLASVRGEGAADGGVGGGIATERGRASLLDDLFSAVVATGNGGDGVTPHDVAEAVLMQQHFSGLSVQWVRDVGSSAEVPALGSFRVDCDSASSVPSPLFPSVTSQSGRASINHRLSVTLPPTAVRVASSATASASTTALLPPRRSSISASAEGSVTTAVVMPAATDVGALEPFSDADEERSEPSACSGRDDTQAGEDSVSVACGEDGDGGVGDLVVADDPAAPNLDGEAPCATQCDASRGDAATAVSQASLYVVPLLDLARSSKLLPADTLTEVFTGSFATVNCSKSTQQPSSSARLMGSHEGRSVGANMSFPPPWHRRSSGVTSTANTPRHGGEDPLLLAAAPHSSELVGAALQSLLSSGAGAVDVRERGSSGTHDMTPATTAAAAAAPSSASSTVSASVPESPSSPPSTLLRRRGTVAAPSTAPPLPVTVPEPREGGAPVDGGDGHEEEEEEDEEEAPATRSPRFVWRELVKASGESGGPPGSAAADAAPSGYVAPAVAERLSSPTAVAGGGAPPPVRQLGVSGWVRWAQRKCQEVMARHAVADAARRGSPSRSRHPSAATSSKHVANNSHRASFPPGGAVERVGNVSGSLYDAQPPRRTSPHLTLAVSLHSAHASMTCDGDASQHSAVPEPPGGLSSPWSIGGNNSWLSVGSQSEMRGVVRTKGGLMQLRRSQAGSPPSSFGREVPLAASPCDRRSGSPTPPSLSFSEESLTANFDGLTASQLFSGSALQRITRSLGSAMNKSASHASISGDRHSLSAHSSTGRHSRMSGSTASAVADDHYRDTLYNLFRHPPSSRIGDLTECYTAYKAMAETSSHGQHVLTWGELGLLLQPEDYIDYCALFPPYHYVTFDDFVEFVEVLSVRHHR